MNKVEKFGNYHFYGTSKNREVRVKEINPQQYAQSGNYPFNSVDTYMKNTKYNKPYQNMHPSNFAFYKEGKYSWMEKQSELPNGTTGGRSTK